MITMDIEAIKHTIKTFAEKYNFIQQKDIANVCSVFNREDWLKMSNKPYISINEYIDKTEIVCGKIRIEIIDEEEYYIVRKNCFFINADYITEDGLIEAIITECKNYKLIDINPEFQLTEDIIYDFL